jgi:predicted TPR repeat methyltransferase
VYDELQKSELPAYLESVTEALNQLISADTLCHFGRLEAVSKAARNA